MKAARSLSLITLKSAVATLCLGLGIIALTYSSAGMADDIERAPSISAHGEAKKTVVRNRVEVLQLRGAVRNPNFLDQQFHEAEMKDVERWNNQTQNITPVAGTKRKGSRMPSGEFVKQPVPIAKPVKNRKVALRK